MIKQYTVRTSYLNSMGGVTTTSRIINAGVEDNIIRAYIDSLLRRDDPSLEFSVSRVREFLSQEDE